MLLASTVAKINRWGPKFFGCSDLARTLTSFGRKIVFWLAAPQAKVVYQIWSCYLEWSRKQIGSQIFGCSPSPDPHYFGPESCFGKLLPDLWANGTGGNNLSLKVPYLDRRHWFAYSLCNFYGATMMIKGSLLLSIVIVKRFRRKKSPVLGQNLMVWGINKGLKLNLSIITPKGRYLRDFTSFELSRVKIHPRVWSACRLIKEKRYK